MSKAGNTTSERDKTLKAAFSRPPVGGAIELRVHLGLLLFHHPPGCRGNEEFFVDAVSEAIGNASCVESGVHMSQL